MKSLSSEQLCLTEAAKILLENREQSLFFNLSLYNLWDLAGVDSLQLTQILASDGVAKLAPFQSLDFIFTGYQYSVLRLEEENFRLGLYGELGAFGGLTFEQTIEQAKTGLRVWVQKCTGMSAIAIPESVGLALLPQIAVAEPSHHPEGLQPNCVALAKIDGISVLIWRHQLLSELVFELQMAVGDTEAVKFKLERSRREAGRSNWGKGKGTP